MRQKVASLINRYGLTLHSFFVVSFIFPPAGAVIAWRIPRLPMIARLAMSGFCALLLVIVPTLGAAVAYFLMHLRAP